MKAVDLKGGDWMAYANAIHGDLGSLPDDQIKAILGRRRGATSHPEVPEEYRF